ncbi:uncharacterized protein LOC144305795 [Canis aureus]
MLRLTGDGGDAPVCVRGVPAGEQREQRVACVGEQPLFQAGLRRHGPKRRGCGLVTRPGRGRAAGGGRSPQPPGRAWAAVRVRGQARGDRAAGGAAGAGPGDPGGVGFSAPRCWAAPRGWAAASPQAVSLPEDSALTWKSVPRRDRARWECSQPGPRKMSSTWSSNTGKLCSGGLCLKDCSGRMMSLKI